MGLTHLDHGPIEAGGDATFAVFFKPHLGPTPVAGTHRVEIAARATDALRPLATGHATVQIGAYSDAAAGLEPMVRKDQRASSYTFNLETRATWPWSPRSAPRIRRVP